MPQRIRENGWLQGALMPPTMYADAKIEPISNDAVLILVSQSCDVVSNSLEAEPYVEFVIATPISESEKDGNNYDGKNPRYYEFIVAKPIKQRYKIFWHDKVRVDRKILTLHKPQSFDLAENIVAISKWMGRKYSRLALPDNFNNRLNPALYPIKKAIKNSEEHISDIYISLSTNQELDADTDYKAILILFVTPETYKNMDSLHKVTRVQNLIDDAVKDCKGIKMTVLIKSEADINLAALKMLIKWDTLDHLSD